MATAKTLHFHDDVPLFGVWNMDNRQFNSAFPGIKGMRADSFSRWVGYASESARSSDPVLPVTRRIYYKRNPSLHKCDARCQHAKGHECECSCGGKNHGIGS
jgi:hypothetical protein